MSQTLLEMAKELVAEQIRANHLSPDDAATLLQQTHATLLSLYERQLSESTTQTNNHVQPTDWKRSIQKHTVSCLECGATFRQLSARHLSTHGLDPRSYRIKYGIPSTQAISAREVTTRRRALAKQIRPWENVVSKRKTL